MVLFLLILLFLSGPVLVDNLSFAVRISRHECSDCRSNRLTETIEENEIVEQGIQGRQWLQNARSSVLCPYRWLPFVLVAEVDNATHTKQTTMPG